MQRPDLKFKWLEGLSEVDAAAGTPLARPLETPFLEWDWPQMMRPPAPAATGWIPAISPHVRPRAGGGGAAL